MEHLVRGPGQCQYNPGRKLTSLMRPMSQEAVTQLVIEHAAALFDMLR